MSFSIHKKYDLRTPPIQKAHLNFFRFFLVKFQIESTRTLFTAARRLSKENYVQRWNSGLLCCHQFFSVCFSLGFFVFFHCSFLLTMRNKQRENAYDSALLLLLLLLLLAFLFYFCSIHSANHRHHRQILCVYCVAVSLVLVADENKQIIYLSLVEME